MNERIKQVRKALGLNQTEFGEKIGVTQGAIAAYESGKRTPIDAAVRSICKTWSVNETWLRTGEGEMFDTSRSDDLLTQLAERYDLDYVGQEILRTYLQMDNASRAALTRFAMALTANVQKREEEMSAEADVSSPAPKQHPGKEKVG